MCLNACVCIWMCEYITITTKEQEATILRGRMFGGTLEKMGGRTRRGNDVFYFN